MNNFATALEGDKSVREDYGIALQALRSLPDHCASNVDDLAARIGANKLALISWLRSDLQFARLVADKVGK
jgi:hypothetical protein